jgi:hypothetical protein
MGTNSASSQSSAISIWTNYTLDELHAGLFGALRRSVWEPGLAIETIHNIGDGTFRARYRNARHTGRARLLHGE